MPEEDTIGQATGGGAPAVQPPASLTAEGIQAMVDKGVQDEVERRVRGLQSTHESQLAGLRKELAEQRADPDRYDADTSTRLEAELAEARQETEALRVARQYPEVFPVYEAILSANGPREQLDILQAYVRQTSPAAPAQDPQAPAPAAPVVPVAPAPVDLNRPVQDPALAPSEYNAEGMNQQLADSIIESVGDNWPKF